MSNVKPDPTSEVQGYLRLLETRGSQGLVALLVDTLIGESTAQLTAARDAAERGDGDALFRAAHTLQGAAAMVGAESVAEACAQLVKAARRGAIDTSEPLVVEVEAGFEAIRLALAGWSRVAAPVRLERAPTEVPPAVKRKKILVIDDDDGIRRITQMLVEALGHEVESARDGLEGLAKLRHGIDMVLLDVVMPGIDGFGVCRRIRQDPNGKDIPVIIVTSLETREHRLLAVEAGASDFITKPVDETELRIRTTSLFGMKEAQDELKIYQGHLEDMCALRTASLNKALEAMAAAEHLAYQAQLETVDRLAILAEYKDKVTANHIQRMSEYCAAMARGLKLSPAEVELILHASRMHDVGKVAVPDSILRKPARLDPAEWVIMRRHSVIGSAILDNSTSHILQAGCVIAMTHHERWDGTGYPNGLAGDEIPLWGRICAVADVFDAMTSERPYQKASKNEDAWRILRAGRGGQFDPKMVDVFFESLEEILAIQSRYRDADPPVLNMKGIGIGEGMRDEE